MPPVFVYINQSCYNVVIKIKNNCKRIYVGVLVWLYDNNFCVPTYLKVYKCKIIVNNNKLLIIFTLNVYKDVL